MSRPFDDPDVEAVFDAYPRRLRTDLSRLRDLIFDTASGIDHIGPLVETLKWGQPSYAPLTPRTGSAVRIDALKSDPDGYAMFFNCQTRLIDTFRELYPDQFTFQGNRALVFAHGDPLPRDALKHCIALSLTYHLRPKHAGRMRAAGR